MNPELVNKIKAIPNIDNGGCGMAALAIARYLEQRGKFYEIVYLYQHFGEYMENEQLLKDGKPLVAPYHAVVVDDDGPIRADYYLDEDWAGFLEEQHVLSIQMLKDSLGLAGTWNRSFDRKLGASLLEDVLGIHLKDDIQPSKKRSKK